MELVREAKGGKVHLDMDDCRDRDYAPVKSKFKSFAGQGHMLGRLFCILFLSVFWRCFSIVSFL